MVTDRRLRPSSRPGNRSRRVSMFVVVVSAFVIGGSPGVALGDSGGSTPGTVMRPSSGVAGSSFDLSLPAGAACPVGGGGERWQTFIVPAAADPSLLHFTNGVPSIGGSSTNIRPLYASGVSVVDQLLPPSGVITVERYFQFSAYPAGTLTGGTYLVGVACTDASGDAQRTWQVRVGLNVNGSGVITSYSLHTSPLAPVLSNLSVGVSHTVSGVVRIAATSPAITSVVITATPTDGGSPGSLTITNLQDGSASFSIGGLTNGRHYLLTAVATNDLETGPPSNTLTVLAYDANDLVEVGNLVAVPSGTGYLLTWSVPVAVTPSSYTVEVSPAVPGSPFTTTSPTLQLNDLNPAITYNVTVTPALDPPLIAVPKHVTIFAQTQGMGQTVSTERPVGVLVLTQTCGRYGALPPEPASPGFAELPALAASGVGSAPTIDAAHITPDPGFGEYPSPTAPIYPTYCALELGTAPMVSSGPEAGKYFATTGRLNQVTVFDTRDTDVGWTVTASATDFTSTSDSFSGNYLGWTPVATGASNATLEGGYQQVVMPGEATLPDIVNGLGDAPRILGQAALGHGLGIAQLDARLKVLIPTTVDSGVYHAIVTITVI